MVFEVDVFRAADELRGQGLRPSIRTVIRKLHDGGSHRAVGRALQAWRRTRELPESEADTGIPSAILTRLDAVGNLFWEAARQKEAAVFQNEREKLEAACMISERRLADVFARLKDTEQRLEKLAVENEVLRHRVAEAAVHQDRRSREYWDRVLLTVGEILGETGPLSVDEIAKRLPASIRREAAFHAEKLTAGTLKKKLIVRDSHDRYVAMSDGRWCKRATA